MLFLVIGCAFAGNAQSRLRGRQPQFSEHPVCSEELDETREQRAAHLSFASYLRYETECVSESDERWNLPGDRPGIEHAPEPDPIDRELRQIGVAGYSIAVARQQVLAILRENSSCSVWYAQAEPEPAEKFASLHFQIDSGGEDTATGEYKHFGLIYREPWVARAQEEVGAGSTITLNSHAAFFVSRAPVRLRLGEGGPLTPHFHKELHVEKYSGGSLNARVTTLLHEYGHIVGLLPVDRGEPGSALRSTRNTDVVLDHCRKQIDASANRMIMLPFPQDQSLVGIIAVFSQQDWLAKWSWLSVHLAKPVKVIHIRPLFGLVNGALDWQPRRNPAWQVFVFGVQPDVT